MGRLEAAAREGYDRLIGLELTDVAVDGCLTKAPCGGEVSGPNPTDRGKLGIKRSTLVDASGLPLGVVSAPANRHDSPLLAPTLDLLKDRGPLPESPYVHLDAGYDSRHPPPARRAGTAGCHCSQRAARACPGHQTLAGRTHPRLAQQLLQARPMHRTSTDRRRFLHRLCQHRRPGPQAPTSRLEPLPLGHPTQPPALTYWRTLLLVVWISGGWTAVEGGDQGGPGGHLVSRRCGSVSQRREGALWTSAHQRWARVLIR